MNPQPPSGFALLCDAQGAVIRVVCDEEGVTAAIAPGRAFPAVVERSSMTKALSFLAEIRTQGAAFNWVLNIPRNGAIESYHFAGGIAGDDILVVGSTSRYDTIQLYEELMRINNEHVNALRQTIKEQSLRARAQAEEDARLYEELSRLNNDLATTQRELAKKNAELERLNDLKNQFLGMAAHDLRTPLAVVLTYSDFLLEETETQLTEEQAKFLRTIQSSSHFMLSLVNSLLDLSMIETGKLELDPEPVDLLPLVEENVALNRVLAAKKGMTLLLHHEGEIPMMMLDALKIGQVLNNLIGNAVKFSPSGSVVEITLTGNDADVSIAVKDNGPGIPAGQIDSLFHPFVRAGAKRGGSENGVGLGLAIVKRAVEGHGGRIDVQSEVGAGSTFTVSLPADGGRMR